jgi:hypothetical protein
MRPANVHFAHGGDLPRHLWDLRAQLPGGGSQAPPDAMGLPTLLKELSHICASAAAGRFLNRGDRASLVADARRSVEGVGRSTASAASPEFADFRSELGQLGNRLVSAEGARTLDLAVGSLRTALRRRDVSLAAWRDVIAAFDDENVSPETCEVLVRSLRELTELRGHLWEPQGLASRLQGVLGDSFAEHPGSTPIDERLGRCEELIAAEPAVADCAIWFVFDNADLTTFCREIGPLLLVPRDLIPDGFEPGHVLENVGPLPELAYWEDAENHLTRIPVEHTLLARVWLTNTSVDQAPQKARTVLESLIEIARPATRWRLYEGYMGWNGGEHFWGSSFLDVDQWERESPPVSPHFEGTDHALTDFKGEFVQRLVDDDAAALEAVEDVRWTIAVRRAVDASQRVALGTRALERTLGIAKANGEPWPDVTSRFLKGPWVHLTLSDEMFDATIAATSGLPRRYTHNATVYEEIHDLVLPESEPGRRSPDFKALASIHAIYGHLWEDDAFSGRIVREACAILTNSQAALAALARLEAQFDCLIARTERQRNALIHGTRPTQSVLDTIDGFLQTLNTYIAQESFRTAETGQTPLAQLEQWRVDALARRLRLENGDNPVDVIFPDI